MRSEQNLKPAVLAIGGFDPSNGAGITVDIKVINEIGPYAMSTITAITAQNSSSVYDVFTPPSDHFKHQLEAVLSDKTFDAIKIGMLSNKDNISVLKEQLNRLNKKLVVLDPVIESTSKMQLLTYEGQKSLIHELLPLTFILTPNISEAETIAGIKINSEDDIKKASSIINDLGPKWVLIKGGHFKTENKTITDFIFDGTNFTSIKYQRINKEVRGTGCIFASAIASYLATGLKDFEAIIKARSFVQEKIEEASQVGAGRKQI